MLPPQEPHCLQRILYHGADKDIADIAALTIPNEASALRAVEAARRLNPDLYIICRTRYASSGMEALRCGADDAIKGEQVVALQFFAKLRDRIECVVGARE